MFDSISTLAAQLDDLANHNISSVNQNISKEILNNTEIALSNGLCNSENKHIARQWLIQTSKTKFLRNLPDSEFRNIWADFAFKIIQSIDYSFLDLMEDRTEEHPQKALFIDTSAPNHSRWSYEQVFRRMKETATAFYSINPKPRVALFLENSPDGAICDLACLAFSILDSPLNVHFSLDELKIIFDSVGFNIAVTDSFERFKKLEKLNLEVKNKFKILLINQIDDDTHESIYLPQYCKTFNNDEISKTLSEIKRMPINQVCTIMFTSGSTGKPKGVSFSNYNLVSKRFARAAALPLVGDNEVLLCFLPLFHTFGRYLEMMGMIYWGGTYVFAANPSAETLLALFPKINPTGFISVPIRWVQLYEKVQEEMEGKSSSKELVAALRKVTGTNLRWGLSAAGYLDPKIFMFFHRNEIELCSGFGMTEATGGITMTPPGAYQENTVGKPLPGTFTKLADTGELLISGHYIARYLDDKGPGDIIDFPSSSSSDFWMPTGDIFTINNKAYYSIIDRLKDIYKNNKGQTIAPRNVEMKFEGVPGIKRTFLVGDGRAYNTLFIVPDFSDSLFHAPEVSKFPRNYFQKIIASANKDLAPYERVVNFELLDRDFTLEDGELTPKGSFNRKAIEKNFGRIIEELYRKNTIEYQLDFCKVSIPRWFYRDLGILEDNIIYDCDHFVNAVSGARLLFKKINENQYQIGDFIYNINLKNIDLGLFAVQPKLWVANLSLMNFAPIKEGWDNQFDGISSIILKSFDGFIPISETDILDIKSIKNFSLKFAYSNISKTLYCNEEIALDALKTLTDVLMMQNSNVTDLVKRRLQALAYHPSEEVRCMAYRILLEEEPGTTEYSDAFPTFLESGLTFLNNHSIEIIAKSKFEGRRLNALRKRLLTYRTTLNWDNAEKYFPQLENVFKLLVNFVAHNPEYYAPVRVELTNWIMHKSGGGISKIAEKYLWELSEKYEEKLNENSKTYTKSDWDSKIIFDPNMSPKDINLVKQVLYGTTFLKQSIILAFDEQNFDLDDVPNDGIWITRMHSWHKNLFYRVSINTKYNKHYDIQMVLQESFRNRANLETVLWLIVVSGYPHGANVLPKIGCARPELEARSMVYTGELTVWEKIREISVYRILGQPLPKLNLIKKLFTEGMAAFIRAWRNSGYQILPGVITPSNVVVPELDFQDGATILTLAGWKKFKNILSIIKPLVDNFYKKTVHHYSWAKYHLNVKWIFDAFFEALDEEEAMFYLEKLKRELSRHDILCPMGESLHQNLIEFLENIQIEYRHPMPLIYAIDKYHEWQLINPNALPKAKEQSILELHNLYRIYRYPEIARYELYRHTYFADKPSEIQLAFEKLLSIMNKDKAIPATQLIELSDLQGVLVSKDDRETFSKMVFPGLKQHRNIDIVKIIEKNRREIIVQSHTSDRYGEHYKLREPIEPAEIGQLYRLFYKEKFPKTITEHDQFIVLLDSQERIIGGVSYRIMEDNTALLDGLVIAPQYKGRGIGRNMMEDYIHRMKSLGIDLIKTNFFLQDFYDRLGFTTDKRWGMMVKILNKEKFEELK